MIAVYVIYLLDAQALTILVHLLLNKRIQRLTIDELHENSLNEQHVLLEDIWTHYNNISKAIAFFVSLALLFVKISRLHKIYMLSCGKAKLNISLLSMKST